MIIDVEKLNCGQGALDCIKGECELSIRHQDARISLSPDVHVMSPAASTPRCLHFFTVMDRTLGPEPE